MSYFIYIVECSDKSLYTGFTNNVLKRVKQHNSGKGSKYIRSKRPVKLVHQEEFIDRSTALKREIEIKGWGRARKLKLIAEENSAGVIHR